jgi:PPK2 family polyphosphate:nucleotide phosphotransferase
MVSSPFLVEPGTKIKLDEFRADQTGQFKEKDEAHKPTRKSVQRLTELQDVLSATKKHALLVVFQAMDGGGKDGSIKHVFSGVNPQGCVVTSFKVPTPLEAEHDFLWRIHNAAPPRGMIGIFNRSQYESVLVERVKKLVPDDVWEKRYDQINAFENLLAAEGTTIIKFFLHISYEEQKRRLKARLADPSKNWKFEPSDLKERKRWTKYMEAFEDALTRCSTPWAPWYIVPADHKWFRNWVVSDTIVRTLETLKLKYPPPLKDADRIKVK